MQTSTKMPVVSIVPNKTSGEIITAYKTNADFGFIQLESVTNEFQGGWLRTAKRSCLLRAEMPALIEFISQNKTLQIPGKITVQEFEEKDVPEQIRSRFLSSKKQSYDEIIEQFLKRAGQDGPVLTTGDSRILRFSYYDPTNQVQDCFVAHDNAVENTAPTATEASYASLPV